MVIVVFVALKKTCDIHLFQERKMKIISKYIEVWQLSCDSYRE